MRPLIQRSFLYDFLPQEPDWFANSGHHEARARFRRKLRSQYAIESLAHCPLCGDAAFTQIATQERHGLPISMLLCDTCGLGFNNPRLDQPSLEDHYHRDYRDIERGTRPDIHEFMFSLQWEKGPDVWRAISPHIEARNRRLRIAEIGCGEGGTLSWIEQNIPNVSVTGYELNAEAVAYGKERGIDIRSDYITRSDRFEVIILEQVLEHLPDIRSFLSTISAVQDPGDLLYLSVPGIFDSATHYQFNFISYLEYGHLFHFCLHTLERLLGLYGYRLIDGDETVRAIFERVETGPATLKSPTVSGAQVRKYILEMEREFRRRGSYVAPRWKAYAKYILTYLGLLKQMSPTMKTPTRGSQF